MSADASRAGTRAEAPDTAIAPPPMATAVRVLAVALPVLIVVAAAALRFAALSSQPGGLYPDEAAEGLDAHRVLHEGYHPIFFTSDAGREALYGYTVAAAFWAFGESIVTLRGVSAAFGVAGVIAIYLALRRFGRGAALAGMAWAAGSLWLVAIARDGMRNITVPLFGALAIWALIRWADRPGRAAATVAGIVAGAGLWTYQPLKLTPLLIALWLSGTWWLNRPRARVLLRQTGWLAAGYLVVVLPLVYVMITNPGGYFGRAVGVSPFNPVNWNINLWDHTWRTLAMFAFTGDPNQRHNVAMLPLLGWPLTLLAAAGLWRAWRSRRDPAHLLLLVGLPVYIVPPLLGIDGGAPHFLRSIGLAAVIAGLIGLGAVEVYDRACAWRSQSWVGPAAAGALALMLAALAGGSASAYFSRPVSARYEDYSFAVVRLADAAVRPGSAVVLDGYSAMDVRFIDAFHLPAIYDPGATIANPGRFSQVLALRRDDLVGALGPDGGSKAMVWSRDPSGQPDVWVAYP